MRKSETQPAISTARLSALCAGIARWVSAVSYVVILSMSGAVFAQGTAPNVIMFVVDDLGWADSSIRSNFYETPNVELLASQGVRFSNAYASQSVCSPTRASLMTGLTPAKHGMTKWVVGNSNNEQTHVDEPLSDFNLNDSFVTLPEALQAGGYHTTHIGKWHLGKSGSTGANPLNHGFDENIGGNHHGTPPSYTNRNSYLSLPNMDSSINEPPF